MPVRFGGDYNPEQWPEDVWDEDVTLMQRANVNLATVGVFSWAKLEPQEGEFDFDWLDDVLDRLHAGGIGVDLATATASPPPWLTATYPEVQPVTREGTVLWPGSRQQYCPSSPVFRRLAARLVEKLAARYGSHPALQLWHVSNEFGCHVSHCYCDVSAAAFRVWLEARYGSIDDLNTAWGTAFWSQQYASFAEVFPPRAAPTFGNPTQLLDFDRFSSDELLECYRSETRILRAATPEIPVTTNFMGFFKPADYWSWAPEVDVIADDSYPDPADPNSPMYSAMTRDLVRSLKHGQPWLLMEQSAGAVNWRPHNASKAPGQMRAWSYQCIARGADGILYFQWRQSWAGAEKFHSGMLPHMGTNTRSWREVETLGDELSGLDRVVGTRVTSQVAIVMEWDSWWAIEQKSLPSTISYYETLLDWYRPFYEAGITVDFVSATDALDAYSVVLVPTLVVTSDEALANLDAYAQQGGHLVVTYQSAILDPNLRVLDDGYLGSLAETLGVRLEEFAVPSGPGRNDLRLSSDRFGVLKAGKWAEFVETAGADVVARFDGGIVDGGPAVTLNSVGAGKAWYIATQPDAESLATIIGGLLADAGVVAVLPTSIPGVEVVRRGELIFAINHGPHEVSVPLSGTDILTGVDLDVTVLEPNDVAILQSAKPTTGVSG